MSKLFFSLALVSVFALGSCNLSLTTMKLQKKYDNSLLPKSIKEKITVYESESEIDKPFSVLSVNIYKPLLVIPILRPYKSVMYKNFYKTAVQKANSTNGDAVLIEAVGYYKVIKFK